ncbi:amidohydrolase family protein [Saccharopolyspora phatthalungensis]|uniref:amidohydrolase family protein n=1 Tax=Saccharopolyspora phatthalungensis TaxID=664693 RepID=UPI0028A75E98|nr:amidohydrolase family protein [Saccharopolyspora phatthalungensis]
MHAHAWLPEVESLVKGRPEYAAHADLEELRAGGESIEVSKRRFGERWERLTDVHTRIEVMAAAQVNVQVVSVSPTQYHSWADSALAWDLAQTTNEGIRAHCAVYSDRLCGLGVAPLRHPAVAVAALEHAVGCGLRGVEISSHVPYRLGGGTIELSDPGLDPLWKRAEELDAVVFLHPWGCTLDARLDRWYLSNSVGQPVEHAVALSHLIFGGVLDRFPRLRLLAAHGGGYLPAFLGRNDHAWRNRPEAKGCRQLPSTYLQRIWFDSLVHTPESLRALVRAAGPNRVVLGSDYPFDMGVEDPVQRLQEAVSDPVTAAAIKGGNAANLNLLPASRRTGRRLESPAPGHW